MEEQKVKEAKMNMKDARDRMFDSMRKRLKNEYGEELASAERKWEFRYENQNKRLKELEATVKRQTAKIRELKAERDRLADNT